MDQNWCKHRNVWAITKVILIYTGSPPVKMSQKALGELLFWTHTVQCDSIIHRKTFITSCKGTVQLPCSRNTSYIYLYMVFYT